MQPIEKIGFFLCWFFGEECLFSFIGKRWFAENTTHLFRLLLTAVFPVSLLIKDGQSSRPMRLVQHTTD